MIPNSKPSVKEATDVNYIILSRGIAALEG